MPSFFYFDRPATSGKVHHCYKFSQLVDIGSHCGFLGNQEIYFLAFLDANEFVSHLFSVFFRSRDNVLLFEIF